MLTQRILAVASTVALGMAMTATAAFALDPRADEKTQLKTCERNLCSLVTKLSPAKGDLACSVSKTWGRKSMKKGSASRALKWSFGDARCAVDLKVARATIIEALKAESVKLELPQHTVNCDVENDGKVDKVRISLAPRIEFKNGKAKKAWVNLKEVEGPTAIKGLVWTAAKLEDSLGIFHRDMIKGINKFLADTCPKVASGS